MVGRWPRFTLQSLVALVVASAVAISAVRAVQPGQRQVLSVVLCGCIWMIAIFWYFVKAPGNDRESDTSAALWSALGGLLILPTAVMDLGPAVSGTSFAVLTTIVVMLLYTLILR